ncbi:protein kinase [Dactylosporangium roseum]|uniref:Protein kinase n=1 Tax=Dactylosporangium roseum TaxID=47989 RepID=A0ABY5YV72_9ACTN|nr:serine/threonine-protein kinase [Dactylosporangium roseum]UWZ33640.1 protein kinase [Dactylosporangium roseum]
MGDPPAPLRDTDPATVGQYRLRGVLGVGGMGIVYLAAAPGGRDVALKVINPALHGDPLFRHRFAAEAAAASRVAGFCTARVLDVALDGPVPYLVTEYVPGPSLHDYATAHGPLEGHVTAVAVGVAAALTAIHAVGLVHADLSPRNVLLSPFGPKVIDFGVARLLGHTGPADRQQFGTPGWLAPEQRRGGPPSHASDVYAWGLLVAWAGTGRLPFAGPAGESGRADLADLADLDGLDPALAEVVGRALRADPAARPRAEQVLLALVGQRDPAEVRVPPAAGTAATARAAHPAAGSGDATAGATARHPAGSGRHGARFAPGAAPVSPRPVAPTAVDSTVADALMAGPIVAGPGVGHGGRPARGAGEPDGTWSGPAAPAGARLRSRPLPPVPPPPRPRPRRVGRAVFTGVALATVLACLFGVLKLAESAGDDNGGKGGPGAVPDAARTTAKPPKPSPVAADGKLRFTVAGLSCGTTELGPWPVTKQAQGQFCLVELKVENIGDGNARVWLGSQHLRDADAREYSPDELSWIYYEKTRPLLSDINPGNSITGTLVFDVPAGVTLAELRVKEHPLSGGKTIRLR